MAHSISKLAGILGYAGLIPFIGLTVFMFLVDGDSAIFARFAFQAYAAIILTFIGGVHWGLVVNKNDQGNTQLVIIASVVPSLLAWVSILLPLPIALAMLLFSFLLLFFYEYRYLWPVYFPAWYRKLRSVLTGVVSLLITLNLVNSL